VRSSGSNGPCHNQNADQYKNQYCNADPKQHTFDPALQLCDSSSSLHAETLPFARSTRSGGNKGASTSKSNFAEF
jgi:hypothetical protein